MTGTIICGNPKHELRPNGVVAYLMHNVRKKHPGLSLKQSKTLVLDALMSSEVMQKIETQVSSKLKVDPIGGAP